MSTGVSTVHRTLQRLEHEGKCGNSLHVQITLGCVEWAEHGIVDRGPVKSWINHLYSYTMIKNNIIRFQSVCFSLKHPLLFKDKDKEPRVGVYHRSYQDISHQPCDSGHVT